MISKRTLSRLLVLLAHAFAMPSLALSSASEPSIPPTEGILMCMTVTTSTTNSLCTSPTGTATANVVGGTGPYTYQWSNGQTTQTATGLGTLVYSVTVTDMLGCVQIATADVDNGGPNINVLTVTHPLCNGQLNGSASVTWTGGGAFTGAAWRVPNLVGPQNSVSNLGPGNFSVGVGDFSTGCVDSMQFSVIDPPALALTFTPTQTSCGLNNGVLTANGSGGTGTLTYNWSTAQSGPTISNLAPGNYIVTLTDANSCSTTSNFTINASSAPTLSITSITHVACNGGATGSATVAGASGSPGYSYSWSNSQTGPTATGLAAGNYTVTVTDAALCTASIPVVINEPTALSGSVSTIAVGCNVGSPNGSATASPAGGTGPYAYAWNSVPAQSTQTATGLAAGNYTVTITDFLGCTTTASGTVGTVSSPTVSVGPGTTVCQGGAGATLSATGAGGVPGYTYNWTCSNPPCAIDTVQDDDPTVTPGSTQTYYVQVTDQNGCTSAMDSVLVTVLPLPVADAGPNQSMCAGDTVQLNGTASGAGPVYTYSWTPVAGLSDPNIANPLAFPNFTTNYSLTVTSNGCTSAPDVMTLTVNPVPTVNAGNDISTCFGNQATLAAVSAGANPVTYTWTAGATVISQNGPSSINVSPTTTTTYTVVATSSANCSSAPDDVTVTVISYPQANAGPDFQICAGESVTLLGGITFLAGDTLIDQSGVQYSWAPAATLSDPSIAQPTATPANSTTYTLTVTHQGCISQNTVQVDVFPLPTAVAGVDDSTICSGDSVQLLSIGSVGTSISWTPTAPLANPAAVNPVAYPTDSMMFYVTVSNGPCSSMDSVFVNVPTTPTPFFAASDTIVCRLQPIDFENQSLDALDLTWIISDGRTDTADSSITHVFQNQGTFTVTLNAIGEGGCFASHSLTMEVLRGPIAEFETEPPFTELQTFPAPDYSFTELASDEIEWIWRFPGDSILEEQHVQHVFLTAGSHLVELLVIDAEGCRDSVQHTITILPPDVTEYNVFSPNGDGINDFFRIDYAGNREYTMTIFDRWGKQIFITKDKLEGWDGKNAGGTNLPEGVYYYTLWVGPDVHRTGHVTLVR